jgi:hypothetical protein
MDKTKLISDVKVVFAYVTLDKKTRRALRDSLCSNNKCITTVFEKLMNDESSLNHYRNALELIDEKVFRRMLLDIETPQLLNDQITAHIEEHEIAEELEENQIEYIIRLLYDLGIIICRYAFASQSTPVPPSSQKDCPHRQLPARKNLRRYQEMRRREQYTRPHDDTRRPHDDTKRPRDDAKNAVENSDESVSSVRVIKSPPPRRRRA